MVLLRNIAQTIPTYTMSCFMIPKPLCQETERMMNSFWWSSNSPNNKGIKWLSWSHMSMAKKKGGLGFRGLHRFNLAILGKRCWNLLTQPNSLESRLLKARYYPNGSLLRLLEWVDLVSRGLVSGKKYEERVEMGLRGWQDYKHSV